jgi:hypothetical protein
MTKFVPIDEATFKRLNAKADKDESPFAVRVRFDRRNGELANLMSPGIRLSFDAREAHGLENASDDDLAEVEIEGAGSSIYFPRLDADFSVPRLLEGFLGPMEWTRRERRAEASRENGKLGGRPRKVAVDA